MNKLKIENLKVKVADKLILDGFNIEIKSGEIHVECTKTERKIF